MTFNYSLYSFSEGSKPDMPLIADLYLASNVFSRAKGLLGTPLLSDSQAILLSSCNAVHTCFMKFAIDIFFIDKDGVILKICREVPPWRFRAHRGAKFVLETKANNQVMCDIACKTKTIWRRNNEAIHEPSH